MHKQTCPGQIRGATLTWEELSTRILNEDLGRSCPHGYSMKNWEDLFTHILSEELGRGCPRGYSMKSWGGVVHADTQ